MIPYNEAMKRLLPMGIQDFTDVCERVLLIDNQLDAPCVLTEAEAVFATDRKNKRAFVAPSAFAAGTRQSKYPHFAVRTDNIVHSLRQSPDLGTERIQKNWQVYTCPYLVHSGI